MASASAPSKWFARSEQTSRYAARGRFPDRVIWTLFLLLKRHLCKFICISLPSPSPYADQTGKDLNGLRIKQERIKMECGSKRKGSKWNKDQKGRIIMETDLNGRIIMETDQNGFYRLDCRSVDRYWLKDYRVFNYVENYCVTHMSIAHRSLFVQGYAYHVHISFLSKTHFFQASKVLATKLLAALRGHRFNITCVIQTTDPKSLCLHRFAHSLGTAWTSTGGRGWGPGWPPPPHLPMSAFRIPPDGQTAWNTLTAYPKFTYMQFAKGWRCMGMVGMN